jgi:hypothetical protein
MSREVVLDSPIRLSARRSRERSAWETGIRYAAAYACTLIAVAAAQLVIRTDIAFALAALCVAGLPLSLWLRRARAGGLLRLAGRPVPRPWINAGVMAATLVVCGLVLSASPALDLSRLLELSSMTQTVSLLMQMFLVFGVCRCLAILNAKDAVLCTVPSFSVLLLLIVIHKGPEVVAFFALWAIASSILLCLDFRSDVRHACSAAVPPFKPNQELKLSGRGLATVLGFSLSSAAGLAYALGGEDAARPEDSWVTALASRLNGFALEQAEVSVNGGPERQIDFSTPPPLPSRKSVWIVRTERTDTWRVVRPRYWRLFTLALYDGRTWSQLSGPGNKIDLDRLSPQRWPRRMRNSRGPRVYDVQTFGSPQARSLFFGVPAGARPYSVSRFALRQFQPPSPFTTPTPSATPAPSTPAPAVSPAPLPDHLAGQARPIRVRVSVRPQEANSGFVPLLPGAEAMLFRGNTQPAAVREREDGSLDVGVMRPRDNSADIQSVVAPLDDFGFSTGAAPPRQRIARPSFDLSPRARAVFLQLPPTLPPRVREWARRHAAPVAESPATSASARKNRSASDGSAANGGSSENDSNYARARRLSAALQEGSFYTLRPSPVPLERDAADFFLFESRRGYCTYFAGALATTCRAVGIPSRIVSGFTNPEAIDDDVAPGWERLRESGAHTWVEVWEPGWGWAALDPTPSESRGNNAPSLLQLWEDMRGIAFEWVTKNAARLAVAVPLALALAFLVFFVSRRRLRLLRAIKAQAGHALGHEDALARAQISVLFERAARRVARRFRPRAAWETPLEWLEAAFGPLALRDEAALRELAGLFVLARFSPRPLSSTHVAQARAAHARLSWAKAPRAQPASTTPVPAAPSPSSSSR